MIQIHLCDQCIYLGEWKEGEVKEDAEGFTMKTQRRYQIYSCQSTGRYLLYGRGIDIGQSLLFFPSIFMKNPEKKLPGGGRRKGKDHN